MLRNAFRISNYISRHRLLISSAPSSTGITHNSCIEILKRFHRLNTQSSPATHYAAAISLLLESSASKVPHGEKALLNRLKSTGSRNDLDAIIKELVDKKVESAPVWNQVLRKQFRYGSFLAARECFHKIRVKNTTSYCLMIFHALEKNPSFVKMYLDLYEGDRNEQIRPATEEHFYVLIRAYAHINNVEGVLDLYRSIHQLNMGTVKHIQHILLWYFWGRGDIDAVVELWRWFRQNKRRPLETMAGNKNDVAWQVVESAISSGWLEEAFEMIQEVHSYTKDQPKAHDACFSLWKASISSRNLMLAKDVLGWRLRRT